MKSLIRIWVVLATLKPGVSPPPKKNNTTPAYPTFLASGSGPSHSSTPSMFSLWARKCFGDKHKFSNKFLQVFPKFFKLSQSFPKVSQNFPKSSHAQQFQEGRMGGSESLPWQAQTHLLASKEKNWSSTHQHPQAPQQRDCQAHPG